MVRQTSTRLLPRPDVMGAGGPPDEPAVPPARLPGSGEAGADHGPRCSCGHGKRAHQHYRKGRDCALCACPRFRRRSLIRLLRR